ncbi:MAG TPA: DinB family protein [Bacteroidota bacterium]
MSWFDEVTGPTEAMFRLVPPDKIDSRATPSSFSLGQLLSHIPRSLSYNTKVLRQEELPLKSLREIFVANRRHSSSTVEEGCSLLGSALDEFRSAVRALDDNRFQTEQISTPQKGEVPRWRFCAFVLEHHIHHLMELHISLKLLGVSVNTGTLYKG